MSPAQRGIIGFLGCMAVVATVIAVNLHYDALHPSSHVPNAATGQTIEVRGKVGGAYYVSNDRYKFEFWTFIPGALGAFGFLLFANGGPKRDDTESVQK
jgi:hypothetical protein